jgi:hypothetical protein
MRAKIQLPFSSIYNNHLHVLACNLIEHGKGKICAILHEASSRKGVDFIAWATWRVIFCISKNSNLVSYKN